MVEMYCASIAGNLKADLNPSFLCAVHVFTKIFNDQFIKQYLEDKVDSRIGHFLDIHHRLTGRQGSFQVHSYLSKDHQILTDYCKNHRFVHATML